MNRMVLVFALCCFFAGAAAAQMGPNVPITVRGQLLLPGGAMPAEPIRFSFTSTDGRINEIRFSDSNGRIILERLSQSFDYKIEVLGDNVRYGNTTYQFNPGYSSAIRVTLNPPPKKETKPGTVSVASAYSPNPDAVKLHEAALKDIEKEDFAGAEAKLRKAVAQDPQFVKAHIDLAALLLQSNKDAEAEKLLRQAIATDPKSHVALLNLGIALNRQKKFNEAIPFLREALRLQSGLVAGHLQLGMALVETGQLNGAEEELLRATQRPGEEETQGLLYLGKLYALTGAFQKSVEALEKYLQKAPTAPNNDEVRALIARMKSEMARANL